MSPRQSIAAQNSLKTKRSPLGYEDMAQSQYFELDLVTPSVTLQAKGPRDHITTTKDLAVALLVLVDVESKPPRVKCEAPELLAWLRGWYTFM
jgi:hypothetical protein